MPFAFLNEESQPVVPNTIKWTLTNLDGSEVINGREKVDFSPLAEQIEIALVGPDFQILPAEEQEAIARRRLTIEITYDSARGANIPANESVVFSVKNLRRIQ